MDKENEIQVEAAQDAALRVQSLTVAGAAATAADNEHRMGLIESIKLYPKAIMFSMIMSLGIVMEGGSLDAPL